MFENVDGRTTDGRTTDAGVTGILIAHLGAFGSGELKTSTCHMYSTLLRIAQRVSTCIIHVQLAESCCTVEVYRSQMGHKQINGHRFSAKNNGCS